MNIGIVGVNTGNIQDYQTAIKGLSAEQAVFALATKGANTAQIEEIMTNETATLVKGTYTHADIQAALAKNGLASSVTLLTTAQQKQIVQSGLITSAKLAEIATTLGLTTAEDGSLISKKALNVEMVKQQLESMGVVGAAQKQILVMLGLTTAESGATKGTNVLAASFAKLRDVISAHPIGAIITAVGTLAVGIMAATNASNKAKEKARQTAIELTNTYTQEKDSLDSQIEKYKELKETLDNGNLSTDEALSIKKQLLEIQQSLMKSYGVEASNIDLVNGKYEEQLGLLSELSKEKATDYVIKNRDHFEDAKKALEKERTYNIGQVASWSSYVPKTEEQQALLNFIDSYSDLLKLDESYTMNKGEHFYSTTLSVTADVESADDIMYQFAEDLEKYGEENDIDVSGILENISKQLKNTWTYELTDYKTIYDEFMKAEIVRNDTLRPLYQQSIKAVENYNNALSSGEGIAEAKTNLDAVQQAAQNVTNELEGSQEVFDDIYGNINHTAEKTYEITSKLNNDVSVKKYAEQLKGLTDDDLKQINFSDSVQSPGEEAFGALINILGLSEDEVQNLIDKLVELGYIQEKLQDSPLNEPPTSTPQTFSEAWSSIGTSGDEQANNTALEAKEKLLELAEAGKLTEKELSKSPLADYFKNAGVSIEEATKKINRMKSSACQLASMETGISSISSILGEKETNLSSEETKEIGISAGTLNAMPDDVKAQTKEYKNFVKVLGSGSSSMDECRAAANELATAYVNSNNFLANLTKKEKEHYISLLQNMGVENAAAVVTNAWNRQKITAAMESFNLKNATDEEITELGKYVSSLDDSGTSLAYYTLQQQIANNNALDTSDSIKNLKSLAEQCGVSGEAIILLNSLEKDTAKLEKYTTGDKKNNANADTIISKTESRIAKTKKNINKLFKKGSQTQTEIDNSKTSNSSAPTDTGKTKQQFDWIETRLNNISKLAGAAQKAISRMLSIKGIKHETKNAIKNVTKELNENRKASLRYTKRRDKIDLPKNLKTLIQNGKIGGKTDIQNITTDEKLQNKIEQFKSLDDKVKHCDESMQELVSTLQELSKSLANIPIEKRDKALERLENIFCTDKDALQTNKYNTPYNAVHPFVYKIHTQ